MKMKILKVPIEKVEPWERNPRGIKRADFERLKKQIQKLGVYKPLVAYRENGKYIVLGGNMRIRALRELGHKEVDVSVVDAKTEKERIEYALSDNDRAGYYDSDLLVELVFPYEKEIALEDFKLDLGEPYNLVEILEKARAPRFKEKAQIPEPSQDQLGLVSRFKYFSVNFSGGKDSLLALLWAKAAAEKLGKTIEVLFVETGAEFPCVSSYVRRFCVDQKLELRVLTPKESILSFYIRLGRWPDPKYRDCQHLFINKILDDGLKTRPEETLTVRGGRPEQRVTRTPRAAYIVTRAGHHIYSPYFDLPAPEYEALKKSVEPLCWPGYKRGFKRTACWICPFQSEEQWDALRENYPPLWEEMRTLAFRLRFPQHRGDGYVKNFRRYWKRFG